MSPQKRKIESYDETDPFVASDDETGPTSRPSKKTKAGGISKSSVPELNKDDEGNEFWEISKARRVTVSDFKGKQMVSIREYYEKDGKSLPGKKGITMTIEQYSTFLLVLPQIEELLAAKGETVPRPQYGGGPVRAAATEDSDEKGDNQKARKANHEATSDEEED